MRALLWPLCCAESTEPPHHSHLPSKYHGDVTAKPTLSLGLMLPTSPYWVKKGQRAGPHPLITQSMLIIKE